MLKIGEFSKLSHTTVKALRFYEKEGLLNPASVDERTGFRYYEKAQLDTAAKIKSLRQLGLTINEIKSIFCGENLKTVLSLKGENLRKLMQMTELQLSVINYIMEEKALNYPKALSEGAIVSHCLHIIGLGEARLCELLEEKYKERIDLSFDINADNGEVRLKISAKAQTEAEAEKICAEIIAEIKTTDAGNGKLIDRFIYGTDVGTIENALILALRNKGMTLGLAESCTGGLLAKRITDIPGASDVFLGGCVTYANSAKENLLGVKHETLMKYGAVSEPVARQMAQGVVKALGADVGLAVTGIAVNDDGMDEKTVGTVYIAMATKDQYFTPLVRKLSMRDFISGAAPTKLYAMALGVIKNDFSW